MNKKIISLAFACTSVAAFAEPLSPFPTWSEPRAVTSGPHEHLLASYFAINSWSPNHRYLLALETDLNGRLPEAGERCTIGLVDLFDNNRFIPITTTACWNFQEAAMGHWIDDDTILFNDVREGKFRTVIMNWRTKAERILPLPVSAVSEDRSWAVSINYARLAMLRPDYGYAGNGQDARETVPWPEDDGLWVMDLKTGATKLILSVAATRDLQPQPKVVPGKPGQPLAYHCHTVISKDGEKIFFLARSVDWFDKVAHKIPYWNTTSFTVNRDGTGLRRCFKDGWAGSHFNWAPDGSHKMLVTASVNGHKDPKTAGRIWGLVEFEVGKEDEVRHIGAGILDLDWHCVYSPDCKFMSGETYWNRANERPWVLTRLADGMSMPMGVFFVPEKYRGTYWRCDLHARYRPDGRQIAFNSVHEGSRQIYIRDITPAPDEKRALAVTPQTALEIRPALFDFQRDAIGWLELNDVPAGDYTLVLGEMTNALGHVDKLYPKSSIRYHRLDFTVTDGKRHVVKIPVDSLNHRGHDPKAPAVLLPAEFPEATAFRFVEIAKSPAPLKASSLVRKMIHYPIDMNSSCFTSSDPTLDAIYELCKYSMLATSFCGVYVDGDRERTPYEADAYVNMLGHYAVDADGSLARQTFEHLMRHPTWPTEWKQLMVSVAWSDWRQTGDLEAVARHYEALKTQKLYAGCKTRDDGLLVSLGENRRGASDIIDWPPAERDGFKISTMNSIVNALHYRNLREMADLARALGKAEDTERFTFQANRVQTAFLKAFTDPTTKLITDGEGIAHSSLHANAMAVACGLVPSDRLPAIIDFLDRKGLACSVYFAQYLLDAFCAAGRVDLAVKHMTATGPRSWKNMLDFGSTITMEAWNMESKPNQDLNHAWGSAPINIIARHLLGVTPLEPGYDKISVKPNLGGLNRIKGTVPTRHGAVKVEADGETLKLDLPAPARVTWRGRTLELPRGQHVL